MQLYQKDLYPFGQLMSSLTAREVQNSTGLFYSSITHHWFAWFMIIFTHFKSFSSTTHLFSIAHFHKNTEWLRLEGTSGGHLVQHPWSGEATWSWLPRTVSRQLLNISKEEDFTASLGNLSNVQFYFIIASNSCGPSHMISVPLLRIQYEFSWRLMRMKNHH